MENAEEKNRRIKLVEQKLNDKDYKLTPQRRATLLVFLENQSKHLSTEDVYKLVKSKYPDIGLATVYRTLQLFDDFDIIKKLNFGDGCYRYELSDREKHQHHHLICLKCGRVYEFEDDLLEELEQKIERSNDFKIIDHVVKFLGYCNKCQKEQKQG
ncbi:MAG TPA: transcriptional repressor [Thermoanaerobacterales bacterium]|nr:transcriptional repressor [Thermoanaerobacterales bacterium]